MSETLAFHTLDVFTDTAYAGNPLAVVLRADALNTAQMQQMAREFNLSETVFVQQPTAAGADMRVRIFTPATELPFAGHPTVGTACLLAALGTEAVTPGQLVLQENVGLVPVRLVAEAGRPWFGELTAAAAPETRAPDFDVQQLQAVLGVEPEAITEVRLASAGNPFVVVRVRQPEVLQGIDFDAAAARRLLGNSWAHALYVVAQGYEGEWRTRMFAPELGVAEDPATGAAAVAFAGALALDAAARGEAGTLHFTLHQGVEMGRPSLLVASADVAQGAVKAVRVGGHAVPVSEGRVRVPA